MHTPSRVSVYAFSPKHFRTGHFPGLTRENVDLSDRQASGTDSETPSQALFSLPDTVRQSARAPAVLPDGDGQNDHEHPQFSSVSQSEKSILSFEYAAGETTEPPKWNSSNASTAAVASST